MPTGERGEKAMKYRYKIFIVVMLISALVASLSINAFAASEIDLSQKGSITVEIPDPITGVVVKFEATLSLYHIASVSIDGDTEQYLPLQEYQSLDLDFTALYAEGERAVAEALAEYVQKKDITPKSKKTTKTGVFEFSNLDLGIYLVLFDADKTNGVEVSPFLVTIPAHHATSGEWMYDITVHPKFGTKTNEYYEPSTKPIDPTTPTKPADPGLPQTGMLRWPIPLCAVGGLVLFVWGWIELQRKRKKKDG